MWTTVDIRKPAIAPAAPQESCWTVARATSFVTDVWRGSPSGPRTIWSRCDVNLRAANREVLDGRVQALRRCQSSARWRPAPRPRSAPPDKRANKPRGPWRSGPTRPPPASGKSALAVPTATVKPRSTFASESGLHSTRMLSATVASATKPWIPVTTDPSAHCWDGGSVGCGEPWGDLGVAAPKRSLTLSQRPAVQRGSPPLVPVHARSQRPQCSTSSER